MCCHTNKNQFKKQKMKTVVVTAIALMTVSTSQASNIIDYKKGDHPKLTTKVSKWVNKHLQYPESAIQNNEEGIVYVAFSVVEGEIQEVEVVGSVSNELDQEALKAVNSVPVSELGGTIAEDKSYILPIKFALK